MVSVLEDHGEDPVADEIRGFMGALNETNKSISSRWHGLGAATARSTIGTNCGRKPRGLITSVRPPICLACRFSPITSKRLCRSSTGPATNLKWAIYDSRLGRGTKRCGKKHPLWRSGPPESARLRLYALRATTELGEAIASALGSPLAAHEKRQFDDGEHKTRPLEAVGGLDVLSRAEPPWRPFGKRHRQALQALVFHRHAQGRRAGARGADSDSGQTSIAFTSGRPGALAGRGRLVNNPRAGFA